MREVVIIEGVRSAVGRRKGMFAETRPDELAALVLDELVARAGVQKGMVEDVILGCVSQVGERGGGQCCADRGFNRWIPGLCAGCDNRPAMRLEPAGGPFRCASNIGR